MRARVATAPRDSRPAPAATEHGGPDTAPKPPNVLSQARLGRRTACGFALPRAPAEPWRASGLTRDGSSNQPLALELVAGLRDVVVGPLLPRPRHEVLDALGEPHARAEAERAADARDVGHAVADVAFAEPADDLRR